MEQNRFFLTINRINSLLILVAAIGALVAIGSLLVMNNQWHNRNAVKVSDDTAGALEDETAYRFGSLEPVAGHPVQTVKLMSENLSTGFSSGYGGAETRNVLFLIGEQMEARWLYPTNRHLIIRFCKLKTPERGDEETPVQAISVSSVTHDTNHDNALSERDDITLALLRPDGTDYTEIATGIREVLDSTVSEDGANVTFLLQIGSQVVARKHALDTFQLVSERTLSQIAKS